MSHLLTRLNRVEIELCGPFQRVPHIIYYRGYGLDTHLFVILSYTVQLYQPLYRLGGGKILTFPFKKLLCTLGLKGYQLRP